MKAHHSQLPMQIVILLLLDWRLVCHCTDVPCIKIKIKDSPFAQLLVVSSIAIPFTARGRALSRVHYCHIEILAFLGIKLYGNSNLSMGGMTMQWLIVDCVIIILFGKVGRRAMILILNGYVAGFIIEMAAVSGGGGNKCIKMIKKIIM